MRWIRARFDDVCSSLHTLSGRKTNEKQRDKGVRCVNYFKFNGHEQGVMSWTLTHRFALFQDEGQADSKETKAHTAATGSPPNVGSHACCLCLTLLITESRRTTHEQQLHFLLAELATRPPGWIRTETETLMLDLLLTGSRFVLPFNLLRSV